MTESSSHEKRGSVNWTRTLTGLVSKVDNDYLALPYQDSNKRGTRKIAVTWITIRDAKEEKHLVEFPGLIPPSDLIKQRIMYQSNGRKYRLTLYKKGEEPIELEESIDYVPDKGMSLAALIPAV